MASYNTSANVVLTLNGKQADNIMASLERKAEALRKKIDRAASAGDKATMQKLQRELNSTKRVMDQLQGSALKVDDVLRRLDSATPKELNKALRQLKRELNGLERGTEAWDAHVRKIKAVRAEMDKVNASLREQQSNWQRFNGWLNQCQTAILGLGAGMTGLVMAGRKAVQAYADMDQEMANVRKFTGLSAEQVEALNEEFKNMDTRTSREELNQLAQQAGRLGKTAPEDILGFVRAADQVNVALDDLGDDATLTLSKLTGVFGDEKRLGTEKALLSVGSVINELSQNCAASAPYLAEFASRMGGVASQADMTVQQVMAFGAVLDSNNQPLEASSTALSQIIVRLYQEPAKYAKVAGLDVQKFTNLVKTDMNAALIELLSTLQKTGGMDRLAPMFADMDENGSRAVATLSTLAGHIEEVKSQQQVANQAFEEATSITKEFDVQNNTVQAGLDKAKKHVTELAVELGQKLMPVVGLVMSSTTIFLQVLSAMVDFVAKYKYQLIALGTAYVSYTAIIHAATIKVKLHNAWLATTKATHAALNSVVGAGKIVWAAMNVVVGLFTGGIKGASTAMKALNATIKANPMGLLISLVTTAISVVTMFTSKTKEATEEQKAQAKAEAEAAAARKKEHEEWKASLTDIGQKSADFCKEELTRLDMLYKAATDEARSKDERRRAAQRLQELYPDYFSNMSLEQIMVGEAATAYGNLREKILEAARAKAIMAKIEENQGQLIELEIEEKKLQKEREKYDKKYPEAKNKPKPEFRIQTTDPIENIRKDGYSDASNLKVKVDKTDDYKEKLDRYNKRQQIENRLNEIRTERSDIQDATNELTDMQDEGNNPIVIPVKTDTKGAGMATGKGDGSGESVDKFAAEKEWREQQEALNTIAYRSGEKDYEQYTARMDAIAVEFYDRQLKHTDLGETERLKIKAQYHEALAKQDQDAQKATLDALEQEYAEQGRTLKQNYIDGLISKETYELKTQEAEMEHQRKLSECMEIGEKERIAAADRYADMLLQNREKAHQDFLEAVKRMVKEAKEHEDELDKIKSEVFGLNLADRNAEYAAELAKLDTVYERELAAAQGNAEEKLRVEKAYQEAVKALREKYMQDPQGAGGFKESIEKTKKWLDSEGGKALTGSLSTVVSGMSSIFSQLTSSMQADLEVQTAAISRRYDAEISRAEGNSYKVAQLEKRKEAEIAAAKNEANRKMFAMQVIQAVAQTAQNAISAYGSALQVGGLAGLILAPIAAAMAVAAGMMQVAAIKKQAQASEAQGYAEGGFTRPGRKEEPAGIVHAGEWVAPQALVESPVTRPLIDALEQARLGNTVPAIRAQDVSRTITAPVRLASALENVAAPSQAVSRGSGTPVSSDRDLQRTMRRLADRLDRPFVTVNAVTGEAGMHKAKRDYERLMANKSPRRRKSQNQ